MPTVSRSLPQRPHLDVPRSEARQLLADWRRALPEAIDRVRNRHPRLRGDAPAAFAFRLSDAQLVIAREYGSATWAELKQRIALCEVAHALHQAIYDDDQARVVELLRLNPETLHLPVRSANWGPPMSHAANLGRLAIVQATARLGARDVQHAFDRALLQGQLDCARWLHAHGARLAPGIVMGSCETLNPLGLRLLEELGAPFTDAQGDRRAPLALALQTYGRNPAGKHAVLDILARHCGPLPDSPMMAFHRGHTDRLASYLHNDPALIHRRFSYREIYPTELGCPDDGRSGLHGTPIDGTTLLHLAIDFHERDIFALMLASGADVNARANVDAYGFGGHTPLFHCLVGCGIPSDAGMARTLLERGALPTLRASLRKFLDWRAEPSWHEAHGVTPWEWGHGFPERGWVNQETLRLLEAPG